jgi:hypothetical protein
METLRFTNTISRKLLASDTFEPFKEPDSEKTAAARDVIAIRTMMLFEGKDQPFKAQLRKHVGEEAKAILNDGVVEKLRNQVAHQYGRKCSVLASKAYSVVEHIDWLYGACVELGMELEKDLGRIAEEMLKTVAGEAAVSQVLLLLHLLTIHMVIQEPKNEVQQQVTVSGYITTFGLFVSSNVHKSAFIRMTLVLLCC